MKKYLALILLSMSTLVITSCGNAADKPIVVVDKEGVEDKEPEQDLEQDKEEEQNKEEEQDKEQDTEKEETAPEGEGDQEVGIAPGMKAPDFTLLGRDGEEISLSDYKGKITFLNFWATTCPYCIDEMPDLEEFYNNHKDDGDVALVGVNMTKTWEKQSKDSLVDWLDNEGLTFPVAFDVDGTQAVQWSARSLPMTFVIDEDGTSLGAIMGRTDIKTLEGILEEVRAGM